MENISANKIREPLIGIRFCFSMTYLPNEPCFSLWINLQVPSLTISCISNENILKWIENKKLKDLPVYLDDTTENTNPSLLEKIILPTQAGWDHQTLSAVLNSFTKDKVFETLNTLTY